MPKNVSEKKSLSFTSVGELNKISENVKVKIDNAYQCKQYCKSANDIFRKADNFYKTHDEEQAYMLFMRYFFIVQTIKKSYEFVKSKNTYLPILKECDSVSAITKAEGLSESLHSRYEKRNQELLEKEELERKKVIENKAKKDQGSDDFVLPEVPKDFNESSTNITPAPDTNHAPLPNQESGRGDGKVKDNIGSVEIYPTKGTISVTDFYTLLKDNRDNLNAIMIVDVRAPDEYLASRINYKCSINVPEYLLQPGANINSIERKLSKSTWEVWSSRFEKKVIVILNYEFDANSLPASLLLLQEVLCKFAGNYHILILEGGFKRWILHYPSMTTDPNYSKKPFMPTLLDSVDLLKNLTYPELPSSQTRKVESSSSVQDATIPQDKTADGRALIDPNFDDKPKKILQNSEAHDFHFSDLSISEKNVNPSVSASNTETKSLVSPMPSSLISPSSTISASSRTSSLNAQLNMNNPQLNVKDSGKMPLGTVTPNVMPDLMTNVPSVNKVTPPSGNSTQVTMSASMPAVNMPSSQSSNSSPGLSLANSCLVPSATVSTNVPPGISSTGVPPGVLQSKPSSLLPNIAPATLTPSPSHSIPITMSSNIPSNIPSTNVSQNIMSTTIPSNATYANISGSVTSAKTPSNVMSTIPSNASSTNILSNIATTNISSNIATTNISSNIANTGISGNIATTGISSNIATTGISSNVTSSIKPTNVTTANVHSTVTATTIPSFVTPTSIPSNAPPAVIPDTVSPIIPNNNTPNIPSNVASTMSPNNVSFTGKTGVSDVKNIKNFPSVSTVANKTTLSTTKTSGVKQSPIPPAQPQSGQPGHQSPPVQAGPKVQKLTTTFGLPYGWEKAVSHETGRIYYKDHNSQTTHWTLPPEVLAYVHKNEARLPEHANEGEKPKPTSKVANDENKPGLKRSLSSPNIADLVDNNSQNANKEKGKASRPVIDRSVKPKEEKPVLVDRTKKPISASRLYNLSPVYGSQGYALTGLKNLGNTCYMNSVIQCLSNTEPLKKYFTSGCHERDLNTRNMNSHPGEIARELSFLVIVLSAGQYRSISPLDFKIALGRFSVQFNNSQQQDGHELLMFLLDGLHEDINKVKTRQSIKDRNDENLPDNQAAENAWSDYLLNNNSVIVDLFQGQFRSTVVCLSCGKKSKTFDAFNCLQLELPANKSSSLQNCISSFSKPEKIGGNNSWKCSKCKCYREASKTIELWKLPPVLIIQLKRFRCDGRWRNKIQTSINFPLHNFNMSSHVVSQTSVLPNYRLYGVINHYGSYESGHYTAFCENPQNGRWYCFDDNIVKELDTGSIRTNAAYLLFYTHLNFKEYVSSSKI